MSLGEKFGAEPAGK